MAAQRLREAARLWHDDATVEKMCDRPAGFYEDDQKSKTIHRDTPGGDAGHRCRSRLDLPFAQPLAPAEPAAIFGRMSRCW